MFTIVDIIFTVSSY